MPRCRGTVRCVRVPLERVTTSSVRKGTCGRGARLVDDTRRPSDWFSSKVTTPTAPRWIATRSTSSTEPFATSEQATAAVLRTEAIAATRGVRFHSIGVTWSDEADDQASLLMRSLSESGLRQRGSHPATGGHRSTRPRHGGRHRLRDDRGVRHRTGVGDHADRQHRRRCGADGVQPRIDSDESLISWLSTVFTKADWQPEALVVVGSAGRLRVDPAATRGCAVGAGVRSRGGRARAGPWCGAGVRPSTGSTRRFAAFADSSGDGSVEHRSDAPRARWRHAGACTMLVAGVLTFVVSVSIAVSLELAPREQPRSSDPVPAPSRHPHVPAIPTVRQAEPPPPRSSALATRCTAGRRRAAARGEVPAETPLPTRGCLRPRTRPRRCPSEPAAAVPAAARRRATRGRSPRPHRRRRRPLLAHHGSTAGHQRPGSVPARPTDRACAWGGLLRCRLVSSGTAPVDTDGSQRPSDGAASRAA